MLRHVETKRLTEIPRAPPGHLHINPSESWAPLGQAPATLSPAFPLKALTHPGVRVFWACGASSRCLAPQGAACNKHCAFLHHNLASVVWPCSASGEQTQVWFGNSLSNVRYVYLWVWCLSIYLILLKFFHYFSIIFFKMRFLKFYYFIFIKQTCIYITFKLVLQI